MDDDTARHASDARSTSSNDGPHDESSKTAPTIGASEMGEHAKVTTPGPKAAYVVDETEPEDSSVANSIRESRSDNHTDDGVQGGFKDARHLTGPMVLRQRSVETPPKWLQERRSRSSSRSTGLRGRPRAPLPTWAKGRDRTREVSLHRRSSSPTDLSSPDPGSDSAGDIDRVYAKAKDLFNSRARRYRPPTDVSSGRPLAYECPVRRRGTGFPKVHLNGNLGKASTFSSPWIRRKTMLRTGVETELLVINAAESFADEKNKTVVTMYCQTDVLGKRAATPANQMQWLHIRYTHDIVSDLRALITNCPFLRAELRSLAINLLDKLGPDDFQSSSSRRDTWRSTQDSVHRVDGKYPDGTPTPDSVTFTATPYIVFREPLPQGGPDMMKGLLSHHYGYDVGTLGDGSQVLPKSQPELGKKIINVAHLGCLTFGPQLLITWSEMPLPTLLGDTMLLEENESHPPIMVRIKDYSRIESYSYIRHDLTFAGLIVRITSVTNEKDFDIYSELSPEMRITSEVWSSLLSEAASRLDDICLSLRPSYEAQRGRYRHELRNRENEQQQIEYYPSFLRSGSPRHRKRLEYRPNSKSRSKHYTPPRERSRYFSRTYNYVDGKHMSTSYHYGNDADRRRGGMAHVYDQKHHTGTLKDDEGDKPLDVTSNDASTKYREEAVKLERYVTPFLMWGVTQNVDETQENGTSMTALVRLLRKIDSSLSGNRLYNNGRRCSWKDLLLRYEAMRPLTGYMVTKRVVDIEDRTLSLPQQSSSTASPMSVLVLTVNPTEAIEPSGPFSDRQGSQSEHDSDSVEVVQQVEKLMEDLYLLSRSIVALFVPIKTTSIGNMEWSLLYAAKAGNTPNDKSWIIRGSCKGHLNLTGKAQDESQCLACDGKQQYTLAGAVAHLHSSHAEVNHSRAFPHEDSCTIWLKTTQPLEPSGRLAEIVEDLNRFKADLELILTRTLSLHQFFARPGGESQGDSNTSLEKSQSDANEQKSNNVPERNHSSGSRGHQKPARASENDEAQPPALPRSLLKAFKNIVALFVVQSAYIEHRNLYLEDMVRFEAIEKDASDHLARYKTIMTKTLSSFTKAQEDLILNITDNKASSVRLGAVGPEYLASMALINVQKGAYHCESGTEPNIALNATAPTVVKYRHLIQHSTRTNPEPRLDPFPSPPVDIIALYASHLARLEVNAILNPQRRAFLEIRALEEELNALRKIKSEQHRNLENVARVLDPIYCQAPDNKRRARYPLEEKALNHAVPDRTDEKREISRMLIRAEKLRESVKESIEVLDEGHGKAIRVFTLVTLFFLPMSFISSFFGMNMADIRDMPTRQWIFWAISLPVTVAVLGTAYLYAYKWEAFAQAAENRWESTSLSRGVADGNQESTRRHRSNIMNRLRKRRDPTRTGISRGRTDTWGSYGVAEP